MRSIVVVVSIVLSLVGGGPAAAQSYEQLEKWCFGDATGDQTIQGCDAVIKSGKKSPVNRAAAFNNRGIAYSNKGQFDRAIQDFDQAIKLKPDDVLAFRNRGLAYQDTHRRKRQEEQRHQQLEQKEYTDRCESVRGTQRVPCRM